MPRVDSDVYAELEGPDGRRAFCSYDAYRELPIESVVNTRVSFFVRDAAGGRVYLRGGLVALAAAAQNFRRSSVAVSVPAAAGGRR